MLPIAIYNELYKFLQCVDEYTASFLEQGSPLDEDGLTNILLSALNSTEKAPRGLAYTAAQLVEKSLSICDEEGFEQSFNFILEHERFSKNTEGKITQADFVLDLSYTDTQSKGEDWRAIYYIQSKKPPSFYPDKLNVAAKIPYEDGQVGRISTLRSFIGEDGLKYAVYCRPKILTADNAATIVAKLSAHGLNPRDWQVTEAAGIWMNDGTAETVSDMLLATNDASFPFAQFIAMHYLAPDIAGLRKYAPDDESPEFSYLTKLAGFDDEAIKTIWDVTKVKGKPGKRSVAKLALHIAGPGPKPILKVTGPKTR
ncbi:hypothetical protein [Agrobacterium sp.]|uniref:hypothetical protein n=1 Tax=Agrobacterium sp. TaxID=361 RepID=UPI0028AA1098